MEKMNLQNRLDIVDHRIGIAAAMLMAIHEAMAYGGNDLDAYTPAIYGVVEYLRQIAKEEG